jgi:hypothetical protein
MSATLKRFRIKTKTIATAVLTTSVIAMVVFAPLSAEIALAFNGAVWTSGSDGSTVNQNIYLAKADVYLNGGPNNCTGNGLPDGDYYFQVTTPDGDLLSTDAIAQRQVQVVGGVIAGVSGSGNHAVGTGACPGGQSVQLLPFSDTNNAGGEYKVWLQPVADYDGARNENQRWSGSKTDNFKVNTEQLGDGTLTVVKVLQNAPNDVDVTDFSFQVNGGTAVTFDADGSVSTPVADGTEVTVTEVQANGTGYTTTYGTSCTESVVTEGQEVTCVITNTYTTSAPGSGTITVQKVVSGGQSVASDFSFQVNGGSATSFEADGENVLASQSLGAYTIVEANTPVNYTASYQNCTFDLAANENEVCVITNTYSAPAPGSGTITVQKVVSGGQSVASDFSFQVNGSASVAFEVDGGNVLASQSLGSYTIVETNIPANYTPSYQNCTFDLAANENEVCIITNMYSASAPTYGDLTIYKVVVNNDGQTSDATDFSVIITGNDYEDTVPFSDDTDENNELGGVISIRLRTGTYSVTEVYNANYTPTYQGCSEINVTEDGEAECTITNDDNDQGDVTDVCSNIDGIQAEVPSGYRADNDGECHRRSSGGGSNPTPTPTPTPEQTPEEQEILGASTQLPVTGVDGGEMAKMAVSGLLVVLGVALVATDRKRVRASR